MPTLFEEIRPLLMDYEELERRCIDCADGHTQTQGFSFIMTETSLDIYVLPKTETLTVQEAFVTLLTQAICMDEDLDAGWWDKYRKGELSDYTYYAFHQYLLEHFGPETEASLVPQNTDGSTGTRMHAMDMFGLLISNNMVENICRFCRLHILLQNSQWGKALVITKPFVMEQLALAKTELDSWVSTPNWDTITCFAEMPDAYRLYVSACSG